MKELLMKQKQMEKLFNKNLAKDRIQYELLKADFDFKACFKDIGIPEKFGLAMLTQMILHKRADVPTLVGLLHHYAENCQQAADYLHIAYKEGLLDWDATTFQFIVVVDITDNVQKEIDRYQYPLPMLIPPSKLRDNSMSGYLTYDSSVLLKNNHHNKDVVLDHINRANKIPLIINTDVVRMIENKWKDLDKQKEGEDREKYLKRVKAFEKYDATSREIIDLFVAQCDYFYLTHKYDKRGRTYSQGYHINYQGNPWNKACIELYRGKTVI